MVDFQGKEGYAMTDWIKRVLTRRLTHQNRRGIIEEYEITPKDTLVYGVKFTIAIIACLTALEIAHLAIIHTWNEEVFIAITGLIGLVTGIIVSHQN